MSNEDVTGLIIAGFSITVILLAALVAWAVSKAGRSSAQALSAGALAPPMAMILLLFASFAVEQDVDGPPPGMVLGGLFTYMVMLVPLCLVSSWICLRILRTSSRN